MSANLNPNVNIAGALIDWDFDTGEIKILSQYGMEKIYALSNGVMFVLAEDTADRNILPVVSPVYRPGSLAVGQYVPVVACEVQNPSPPESYYPTFGKKPIVVRMWSVQPDNNIGFDRVPFALLVQALSPADGAEPEGGGIGPGPGPGGVEGGGALWPAPTRYTAPSMGHSSITARTSGQRSTLARGGRRERLLSL